MIDSKKLVEGYLSQSDWRVKESSSVAFSYGGLCKSAVTEVSKDYWLNQVYPDYIKETHKRGDIHIHDLGGLTLYCCGFSMSKLLTMGIQGIPNVPKSKPAKHFTAALAQVANIITTFQNEIMGAVAYNSFDTYLAPFIKEDNLTYEQVEQAIQGFIYQVNSNARLGAEPVFFNITLDITPPKDLVDKPAYVGGMKDYTYKDCQKEMDMFNRAFYSVMMNGDADGHPFSYPIPTYNIHKRFDWNNEKTDPLWEMAGKHGYPYFSNYINSDMDVSDSRSMCCRLRLDLKELRKKNGGLFGSGDDTGSTGVVTINLPRIAYLSRSKEEFFKRLEDLLVIASDSLEIKKHFLEKEILPKNLLPAFNTYVGSLKNHFLTIGEVGRNEACLNLLGKDILSPEGRQFAIEIGEFIRKKIQEFQEKTGNLYNYEATPAESTCYRLAKKDKELYPDIITQGEQEVYYTNSCHIPVKDIKSIIETFTHQEPLQVQYTGGTVIHIYTNGRIDGSKVKTITKKLFEKFKVPYISWSPLLKFCENHKYVDTDGDTCPICGKPLKMYQRITGYIRETSNFNTGKKEELRQRNQLKI